MQQIQWNTHQIKQCKQKFNQAVLADEHSLILFSQDFGRLLNSKPAIIFQPTSLDMLQNVLSYVHTNVLPLTIRGNGMSQSGQSLAQLKGGILHMQHFSTVGLLEEKSIWVDANASWAALLDASLAVQKIPYVIPYNCDLSIGGVLSAGGIGSASFKYGSVTHHVKALEIVKVNGEVVTVDADSELGQAVLGGQGYFGVITKAQIALKPCLNNVRTFFMLYIDKDTWLADLHKCQQSADYIESFCSPSVQGAKLSEKGRMPFAEWFYAIHVSYEYATDAPAFNDLGFKPWKLLHHQDESIHSYLHRHDSRFAGMKVTGQWELQHPWYECFIPEKGLDKLEEILASLPIYYATVVQIVPVASQLPAGLFMLPKQQPVVAIMILNPGLPNALIANCLATIESLDQLLLPQQGKRYLSGYLGSLKEDKFWRGHFSEHYPRWLELKKQWDPQHCFQSYLLR